jgi:microsomal dipeptidase-like Zn-dependent dipeptidase
MAKFADIHCHSGMHPFAYDIAGKKKNNNVWDYDPPKGKQRISKYPEYTQSDFTSMAKGGVRLIFISIYPIEQGWFDASIINEGFITDVAAKVISRVPVKFINMVQSDSYQYFDFFSREYHFLKREDGRIHNVDGVDYKYVVLRPTDDIEAILKDEHTIGVIMSVEGAQSFILGNERSITTGSFSLEQTIMNIEAVKKWDHPPFFVSMSHHFYNGFCGHTRSLPAPASLLLKQAVGLNEPINEKGRKIIDCFLGLNEFEGNGQRIIIDTKHMSVAARQEYYAKVKEFNQGRKDEDKIPIVVSHTAYSQNKKMTTAIEWPDTDNDKYKASGDFNNWAINLSDDEIIEVFHSNGIMGLNFDERILSGYETLEEYKEDYERRDIKRNDPEVAGFWARQMLNNILGIVKAVFASDEVAAKDKPKIWNMLAIGTDFDGMINPEDGFITAEEFTDFRKLLLEIMPGIEGIDDLLQGLAVESVVDKIMFDNAYDFAKMYYFK